MNILTDFLSGKPANEVSHDFLRVIGRPDLTEKLFSDISVQQNMANDPNDKDTVHNQLQNQRHINNARLVLLDPAKSLNKAEIQNAIKMLTEARNWARKHHFIEDENDSLWGLHKCFLLTADRLRATDTLQDLRKNLEQMRCQISDPHERAGIFATFPNLFPVLCQLLYQSNRTNELLDAIESAKGRVIADVLLQKKGQLVPDSAYSRPALYLPGLIQKVNAHYLSYFVVDEKTYAVLVARDGSVHASEIPIGKKTLREWTKGIDPKNWNESPGGLFGTIISANLPDRLTPLVKWLEPLMKSALIRQGDHICYSPDDKIHLIPLHYTIFQGKPLVHYLSLSRIQGAYALLTLLKNEPKRPKQSLAIQVPARQDLDNTEKLIHLARVPNWLSKNLPCRLFLYKDADIDKLLSLSWCQLLVHFATHGTFPKEELKEREQNPFHGSGLALAKNNQLPSLEMISTGKANDMLMTPEKILDLDFSGSHVTMQACVSGLAKEGIGGDALGLEWALLQAGANSLLATHWNVQDAVSADFCLRFYQKWLVNNASRADAWRDTVLELMERQYNDNKPKQYYWAGFSLSGDWR